MYQVCLLFGQNFDEVVEIRNTSTSNKLEQLVVAVTWLYNVDNMISLWPRDTSFISELSDKYTVGVNAIQQMNTIDSQLAHPGFIQRTNITIVSWDIYTFINIITNNCFNLLNLVWTADIHRSTVKFLREESRNIPICPWEHYKCSSDNDEPNSSHNK